MKKICVISPLGYTGIAYYDFSLCYSLTAIGAQVDLLSTDDYVATKPANFRRIKVFKKTYGNIPKSKKGFYYLWALVRCLALIVKNKYAIAHVQKMELPALDVVFFAVLKALRVKLIYTPHDIYSFKSTKENRFMKLLYRLSDVIIVHNNANRQMLVAGCGVEDKKIRVISHGNYRYFLNDPDKEISRKRVGIQGNKKVILLFGNIRPHKGIETSVSAMEHLTAKDSCELLIVGKLSKEFDLDSLKRSIRDLHLSGCVTIRDQFVSDDLIESYYKAADVILVPYETAYESGVLKYAFSCAAPVVVSDLPEFSEFCLHEENCLVFRKGDPVDLAAKIDVLLSNDSLAKKVSSNAKAFSDKEWNWEKLAHDTERVYDSVLV